MNSPKDRVPNDANSEEDPTDSPFIARLIDYQEQLMAGREPCLEDESLSEQLRDRLGRARNLLRQLDEMGRPDLRDTSAAGAAVTDAGTGAGASIQLPGRIAHFQVLRELGTGGFGIVLLAHDEKLNRNVALKIPRLGALTSHELRQRFLREATAAAALDHPNIVPVYETGEDSLVCYIASAYCRGPTLAEWLRSRQDPVPPRLAAWIIRVLAMAIQHAHGRGVLHRDLKPGNVLLEPVDEGDASTEETRQLGGTLRIADFGLAKLLEEGSQETVSGQALGTAAYMAPEQAAGKLTEVGPACDVYALGVVLYELLTGRPPLIGESDIETLQRVQIDEPVPPRRVRPRLPRDLETICLACLRKEPDRRYASAELLAADLQRFLQDEPILARRTGAAEHAWRWCRRNPMVSALAVIILVVTVTGFAGVTWQWRVAEQNRRRAEVNFERAWDAADKLLTEVATTHLVAEPRFELVRRSLLEEALKFYSQFLHESDDPAVRREAGRAYVRAGDIRHWLGQDEQARSAYEKAIQVLERLPASDSQFDLAGAHYGLAELLNYLGDYAAAEEHYRQALKLYEQSPSTEQAGDEFQASLSGVCSGFGALLARQGRADEAQQLYSRAVTLQDRLSQAEPDNRRFRYMLVVTLHNQARLYQDVSRIEEAKAAFLRGQQLLLDMPGGVSKPDERQRLFSLCDDFGGLLGLNGEQVKALDIYRNALEVAQELADQFPNVREYLENLARAHGNIAWTLSNLDRWEEADKEFAAAADFTRQVVNRFPSPESRSTLGNLFNNIGNRYAQAEMFTEAKPYYERALEIRRQLADDFPEIPEHQSNVGGTLHNLAAVIENMGDTERACDLYRQAVVYQQEALKASPENSTFHFFLRNHYWHLGRVLRRLGKAGSSKQAYENALVWAERVCEELPEARQHVQVLNSICLKYAQLMLHSADPSVRDSTRAVKLLEGATKRSPKFANYWAQLGLAYYRTGQWSRTIETLEYMLTLKQTVYSDVYFLMAMAHERLSEHGKARQYYEQAVRVMNKVEPDNEYAQNMRREAAELLGLDVPEPAPVEKDTQAKEPDAQPK